MIVGAAGGLALGYVLDHYMGDSNYTGREAFVDAATGAIGGGLINPVAKVATRANRVIRGSTDMAKVGAGDSVIIAGYVSRPMISKPVAREFVGGALAGFAYDLATQSSGSRSERNGPNVGPGGTGPAGLGSKGGSKMVKPVYRRGRDPCPPGYRLRTVNGKRMCVMR